MRALCGCEVCVWFICLFACLLASFLLSFSPSQCCVIFSRLQRSFLFMPFLNVDYIEGVIQSQQQITIDEIRSLRQTLHIIRTQRSSGDKIVKQNRIQNRVLKMLSISVFVIELNFFLTMQTPKVQLKNNAISRR